VQIRKYFLRLYGREIIEMGGKAAFVGFKTGVIRFLVRLPVRKYIPFEGRKTGVNAFNTGLC